MNETKTYKLKGMHCASCGSTIEKIFKKGSFIGSNFLNLKYFFSKDNTAPRISFIVPKKIEKTAVGRNSLRRKGYLILKKYLFLLF